MNQQRKVSLFTGYIFIIVSILHPSGIFALQYYDASTDSIEIQLDSGRARFYAGHYEEALKNFYKVVEICERTDNQAIMAKAYNNIGAIYSNLYEYDLALKYLEQSMEIKEALGDEDGAASTMVNIAGIYQELNDYEKALKYYYESLNLKLQTHDSVAIAAILNNIGIIHHNRESYNQAIEYLERSLTISREMHDNWSIANSLNNLSEVYYRQKNYAKALALLNESQPIIDQIGALELRKENLDIRMKSLAGLGNYKDAFELRDEYDKAKDSIISSEKAQNIAELEAKYESEKRERENRLLKIEMEANRAVIQRQRIIFIASGLVIIILLIVYFILLRFYRLRKKAEQLLKQQKEEIESQNVTLANLNKELNIQNAEITKQKAELENLIKLKDKLFSILSHDLRSPLNSLSGLLKLIKKGLLNKEEEQKYLNELDKKIGYTQHFLENMLQWSRSQLDGFTINQEKFDISELVNDVCNNYDLQAREKGITLDNAVNQSVSVVADQNMIKIALGNLVSNAIKFSPPDKKVIIDAELIGKKCKISVKDHGAGMSKETIDQMNTGEKIKITKGTGEETGSGLGLIVTKDFIEKNGGSLFIDSKEKKGSTFSLTIPINN